MIEIGAVLGQARHLAGLTLKELASMVDLHYSTVSRYECGLLMVPEHAETKIRAALATKGVGKMEITQILYLMHVMQLKRGKE